MAEKGEAEPSEQMASPDLTETLERATALKEGDPDKAVALYHDAIGAKSTGLTREEESKLKEQAVTGLVSVLVRRGQAEEIAKLTRSLRGFFAEIPKARTAKIVRALIEAVAKVPNSTELQVNLCNETIEWCRTEKRTFLRQRIEGRLAALHMTKKRYTEAMVIIDKLLREVKRLDDKAHLLEIQLLESRAYHALRNLPKARAALTSARTTANAIYVPPGLQADIDSQAGIVTADENDYKTAYSYFYEAFESFMSLDDPRSEQNLKYMLLCKIMTSDADDFSSILNANIAIKYNGPQIEAMKAVAKAYSMRSVEEFEKALKVYDKELNGDPIVHMHLSSLYDSLLEQNLLRLIEPFSTVEISHVAKRIKLPLDTIEAKLSQLILDKKLNGILDQSEGCLIVFDEQNSDSTYETSLSTLGNMDRVVDTLFEKATMLR